MLEDHLLKKKYNYFKEKCHKEQVYFLSSCIKTAKLFKFTIEIKQP